jgi:hypothetical protein
VEFTGDGEPHRLWIEASGDNATVMMASEKESLANFLKSKEVKKRSGKDPAIAALVTQAKAELKKIDDDADGVLKALKQISQEKSGSGAVKASTQNKEKVTAEERALAETLTKLLDAMHVDEPMGGVHGKLCAIADKSKGKRESHHVPAKTLGKAIGEFLAEAAAALRRKAWRENDRAKDVAKAMSKRSKRAIGLATEPANKLSAILISHGTHKGEFGVHSSDFAEVMFEIEEVAAADGLIMCKNKAAKKIKGVASYISVNPQMPGWREFLADVQRQLSKPDKVRNSKEGRGDTTVLQLILEEAASELAAEEKATDAHLDKVMTRINKMLDEAPAKGFQSGRATVARAMALNLDGTPAGQEKALDELRQHFEETWVDIRDPI